MDTDRITHLLNNVIDRLEAKRGLNVMLLVIYGAFILFGHDPFVKVSIRVMNELTLPVYNALVTVITVSVAVTLIMLLMLFLKKSSPDRPLQVFYLISIVLAMALHYIFLFEMNIEVIHAALYAGLAFVLFPLTRRSGPTMVFAIPVMMLDEWYQYIVLYPEHVLYFDFNDILMDMLGSATLLCGIWVMGVRLRPSTRPWHSRIEAVFLAGLLCFSAIAAGTCHIVQFPENACDHTLLILNRLPEPLLFWQIHPFSGKVYHAMPPIAGTVAMTLAALFFMGMRSVPPQRAEAV
jgi:hypothetical protein